MTALTNSRTPQQMDLESVLVRKMEFPVAATTHHFVGALVATNNAGFTVVPTASTSLVAQGVCIEEANNTGSAGAIKCKIQAGTFSFFMGGGGDALTIADRGKIVYMIDDQTVGKTNGSNTRSPAGYLVDVQDTPVGTQAFVTVGQPSLVDDPAATNSPQAITMQAQLITDAPVQAASSTFVNIFSQFNPTFHGGTVIFFMELSMQDVVGAPETWEADVRVLLDGSTPVALGHVSDVSANTHRWVSFTFATALITAGAHTIDFQINRVSGAGTITMSVGIDWASISFIEL